MAHKIKVQYTKRYYKTVTREIEISGMIGEDEINAYLDSNFPKDEIDAATLNFEDDEFYILENEELTFK